MVRPRKKTICKVVCFLRLLQIAGGLSTSLRKLGGVSWLEAIVSKPTTRSTSTSLLVSPVGVTERNSEGSSIDGEVDAFTLLCQLAGACLLQSDIRRDAVVLDPSKQGTFQQASSASNWIHEPSAFALQQALNQVKLRGHDDGAANYNNQPESVAARELAARWVRWMKATPSPAMFDLSTELHASLDTNTTVLGLLGQSSEEFKSRLFCRVLLFPSGVSLDGPLVEPPSSIVYGKLLYGGVLRYRLLESSSASSSSLRARPRRAGERTAVQPTPNDRAPCWIMYGGAKRMYEALDMGPAAILEVGLLARRRELMVEASSTLTSYTSIPASLTVLRQVAWSPHAMLDFAEPAGEDGEEVCRQVERPSCLAGSEKNQAFRTDFASKVGGLSKQIDAIVRRVLDGRVLRPADFPPGVSSDWDDTTQNLVATSLEAAELSMLGLEPVRGLLLFGPPGCGKTALAREISRALRARAPKIVAAPELLDRWVGGSEKAVRALFADAEAELAACGGDATRSALHVVVIDEIDAVFRKRTSAEDSGEATRSSVVNQILSKLDGVNAIPNVLLIGMTNRRELLDDALLRPGRLEVQIEIPLPDREGRREILQIHFGPLRERGRLSQPLCDAIDGRTSGESAIITDQITAARPRKRDIVRNKLCTMTKTLSSLPTRQLDLAADAVTGGFSGADIAGLVRCAGSIALARARIDGSGVQGILITLDDVKQALVEMRLRR